MIVQILLVLAAFGAAVYFVRRAHNVRIRASKRIAFFAFIAVNIYAVLRPEDTTWIAQQIGVGRGTDLLLYALVMVFLAFVYAQHRRHVARQRQLTLLSRRIALLEAHGREGPGDHLAS